MAISQISIAKEGPTFSRMAQGTAAAARWGIDAGGMLDLMWTRLDRGVTTFDTAPVYSDGAAEALIGGALSLQPDLRAKIQIVTKCSVGHFGTQLLHYDTRKSHIIESVEGSLRRLNTDYVDVLLIHRPDPLMDADEVASAFNQLHQAGKVLYFGVSNFTPSQFELLASRLEFPLVTNEIQFSVMYLDTWYDGTLDLCQRLRISPLAWSPLGAGRLFTANTEQTLRLRQVLHEVGEFHDGVPMDQIALAWILQHPAQCVPILGTGKLDEFESAVCAEGMHFSREEWFQIWCASTGERLL